MLQNSTAGPRRGPPDEQQPAIARHLEANGAVDAGRAQVDLRPAVHQREAGGLAPRDLDRLRARATRETSPAARPGAAGGSTPPIFTRSSLAPSGSAIVCCPPRLRAQAQRQRRRRRSDAGRQHQLAAVDGQRLAGGAGRARDRDRQRLARPRPVERDAIAAGGRGLHRRQARVARGATAARPPRSHVSAHAAGAPSPASGGADSAMLAVCSSVDVHSISVSSAPRLTCTFPLTTRTPALTTDSRREQRNLQHHRGARRRLPHDARVHQPLEPEVQRPLDGRRTAAGCWAPGRPCSPASPPPPPAPRASRASCRLSPTSPSSVSPSRRQPRIAVASACGAQRERDLDDVARRQRPLHHHLVPARRRRAAAAARRRRACSATAGLPSSSTCAGSQCLACPGSVTTAAASAPTSNRSRRRSADASIASRPIDAQLGAHLGSATRRSRSSVSSSSSGSAAASGGARLPRRQRRRQHDARAPPPARRCAPCRRRRAARPAAARSAPRRTPRARTPAPGSATAAPATASAAGRARRARSTRAGRPSPDHRGTPGPGLHHRRSGRSTCSCSGACPRCAR